MLTPGNPNQAILANRMFNIDFDARTCIGNSSSSLKHENNAINLLLSRSKKESSHSYLISPWCFVGRLYRTLKLLMAISFFLSPGSISFLRSRGKTHQRDDLALKVYLGKLLASSDSKPIKPDPLTFQMCSLILQIFKRQALVLRTTLQSPILHPGLSHSHQRT